MNDDRFADFFARMAEVTRGLGRIATADDSGALAILDDALRCGAFARVEIGVGAGGPIACSFSLVGADGTCAHLLTIDAPVAERFAFLAH